MSTAIAWTDETWNPVVGCTRVSAGCDHCYASALHNRRYKANVRYVIEVEGDDYGGQAVEGARDGGYNLPMPAQYDQPFAKVQLLPERLERPLHWTKPRRVFVNSMSDLFHEDVPDDFIDRVFAVMALSPKHTFQVLTKRPERMRRYLGVRTVRRDVASSALGIDILGLIKNPRSTLGDGLMLDDDGLVKWPLPNVWMGVSIEDQATADARIPELLATPAAVRWVSLEPQLASVSLDPWMGCEICREALPCDCGFNRESGLDWVVQGGESGAKARPFDVRWARDVRDQCKAAKVPYFLKQLGAKVLDTDSPHILQRWLLEGGGEWTPAVIGTLAHERPQNAIGYRLPSRAGSDESEWPLDLQGCRAWPKVLA